MEQSILNQIYLNLPKYKELINYDNLISRLSQQNELITLINEFNLNLSDDEQERIVDILLDKVDEGDYDLLIDAGHKHTWPGTVRMLIKAGYPKNKKALPSLILLLQDINWPGAIEGMSALKEADKDVLIPLLEIAIEDAFNSNDYIWLAGIEDFLSFAQINKSDFTDEAIYGLLEYAEF